MTIPYQLESERILYRTRRSAWALALRLLQSLWQGAIAGIVLALLGGGVWYFLFGSVPVFLFVLIVFLTIVLLGWRRYYIWKYTALTITTDRILVHLYATLFRDVTHTVPWRSFQESIYEGGFFDHLLNTGTLTIRYGTMDAQRSASLWNVPYAYDLKHYLDKIQSLIAAKTPGSELPAFVPVKKGKRDKAVLTYVD